ncbi:protein-L-isoaspartate(D-aspartate) O-methyltransferase [Ancylobacter sp. 6x-1]|uniref:Protein-L-isoaspartate O-methyltransferase n=1 Tax=Ancylobacter crimeensis TaxID=2579147 RepID=A0ABT0D6K7_9HYPH|nr:protein-L-isoaspartate(D-aspartate) O-methyltransferase [Ancylobacter crimeensis]
MASSKTEADVRRAALLLSVRRRGIRDPHLMRVFEQVPRDLFVDEDFLDIAFADQALPIACGQTISQPAVVALMTQMLDLASHHSVLEVGTGSGYHAAILGHLAGRVVSVERFRALARTAADRLKSLGLENVEVRVADGRLGYPPRAPFDRIIVTAAAPEVPPALFEQLLPGGVLVAPVGPQEGPQMLMRYERMPEGMKAREVLPVRFVPLLSGIATVL